MTNYSREELFELASAYALGATTADETAAVEAALPTLPDLAGTFALLGRQRELEASRLALAAKLEHRETTLNTLLHAEKDLRVMHLKAADTVKGPGIQFFWNEKEHSGVAHAFRLPPAPANHSYQPWAIVDGRATSVKVFNSDPDGHALVESFLRGLVPATY
jgi:Anti-sigma-K factor rskA